MADIKPINAAALQAVSARVRLAVDQLDRGLACEASRILKSLVEVLPEPTEHNIKAARRKVHHDRIV